MFNFYRIWTFFEKLLYYALPNSNHNIFFIKVFLTYGDICLFEIKQILTHLSFI